MHLPRSVLILLSITINACAPVEDADDGDAVLSPDAGPEDFSLAIDWRPCPSISGADTEDASCAAIEVPLHWQDPARGRTELWLKRIGAPDAGGTMLWMLNGGPGGPGSSYEALALQLTELYPDLQVFLLDHRGVGRSSRLGCSAEDDSSPDGYAIVDSEWPACIEELVAERGPELSGFTTTEAARDLIALIAETRVPGRDVQVWGGSYGTRWLQRFLLLAPNAADAVQMMGVVRPGRSFADYDLRYDQIAGELMELCAEDAECSARLGEDAEASAREIFSTFTETCAGTGLSRQELRNLFAHLLLYTWEERALIPAVLYRLGRCSDVDRDVLGYLDLALSQPVEYDFDSRMHSPVLGMHIVLSEFWTDAASEGELQDIASAALASFDRAPRFARLHDSWPTYAPDDYLGRFPSTDTPALLVQGSLDPATTADQAAEVAAHFTAPSQHFILLSGAPHNFNAPVAGEMDCAVRLFLEFIADPSAAPSDCAERVDEVTFASSPAAALYLGTDDIWDGELTADLVQDVGCSASHLRAPHPRRHANLPADIGCVEGFDRLGVLLEEVEQ